MEYDALFESVVKFKKIPVYMHEQNARIIWALAAESLALNNYKPN